MVALVKNSPYLPLLTAQLEKQNVTHILVLFSCVGGRDQLRSEVLFKDSNNNTIPKSFLNDVLHDGTNKLSVHDLVQAYITTNCRVSREDLAAASFTISVKTWAVQRTEFVCDHPIRTNAVRPAKAE